MNNRQITCNKCLKTINKEKFKYKGKVYYRQPYLCAGGLDFCNECAFNIMVYNTSEGAKFVELQDNETVEWEYCDDHSTPKVVEKPPMGIMKKLLYEQQLNKKPKKTQKAKPITQKTKGSSEDLKKLIEQANKLVEKSKKTIHELEQKKSSVHKSCGKNSKKS